MSSVSVSRTLVKSPPEVWAELEREGRLAELLALDGLEVTVAQELAVLEWNADQAHGRIEITASGWGTKVSLTADVAEAEVAGAEPDEVEDVEPPPTHEQAVVEVAVAPGEEEPRDVEVEAEIEEAEEPSADDEPEVEIAAQAVAKLGFWARLKQRFEGDTQTVDPEKSDVPEAEAVESHPSPEASDSGSFEASEAPVTVQEHPDTEVVVEVAAVQPGTPEPDPPDSEQSDFEARLVAVLDHLGAAHKRPFSSM